VSVFFAEIERSLTEAISNIAQDDSLVTVGVLIFHGCRKCSWRRSRRRPLYRTPVSRPPDRRQLTSENDTDLMLFLHIAHLSN
jgi:hypothetical protein